MNEKQQSPRGVPDIFPPVSETYERVEQAARRLFDLYGYRRIDLPVFEHTEVFARSLGATTDIVQKEMYTFLDRSERALTLRPEGTAGVVRAYVERSLAQALPNPARLYYIGPMFRYERPQEGRGRQFVQLGPEAIGSDSPTMDAEIIVWGSRFFDELGLTPKLLLSSMGCVEDRQAYLPRVSGALSEHSEDLCEDCRVRLTTNPLRIFDCKNPKCQGVVSTADLMPYVETICEECRDHLKAVESILQSAGIRWTRDSTLVRGMDYYTKTVFEFHEPSLGARAAVGAGGRYDGLVRMFGGASTPAVGMAVGVMPTVLAMEKLAPAHDWYCDAFVTYLAEHLAPVALAISQDLRAAGLRCVMSDEARSLKSQLRSADKHGARSVVILGEAEAQRGAATVKNMKTNEQIEVAMSEIVSAITGGR